MSTIVIILVVLSPLLFLFFKSVIDKDQEIKKKKKKLIPDSVWKQNYPYDDVYKIIKIKNNQVFYKKNNRSWDSFHEINDFLLRCTQITQEDYDEWAKKVI